MRVIEGKMGVKLKINEKCHYYLDGQCLGWAGGKIGEPYPKCNSDFEYCMKG